MDTLFRDLNDTTRRVLEACGHTVVEVRHQGCCGALHAHAGALDAARELAEHNIAAFDAVETDLIVVNSAGCGALLREYQHLVESPAAARMAAKVRDITEILAESTLPAMRPLDLDIAYDPPCHLQHAQRVHDAPLKLLRSIPGVRLHLLPGADRCCGAAGLYGVLHPELSHQVLREKLEVLRSANPRPHVLVTGNPGCLMQFRAGLLAERLPIRVAHPIQLVAWAMGEEARSEKREGRSGAGEAKQLA
jgi:glycolate oxidase iron-sulfur subunit